MNRENTQPVENEANPELETNLPPAVEVALKIVPDEHKKTFQLALAGLPNLTEKMNSSNYDIDIGAMGEKARQFVVFLEKWGLPGLIAIFGGAAGWYLPSLILPDHDKSRYAARALLWYTTLQISTMAHELGSNFIPHIVNLLSN